MSLSLGCSTKKLMATLASARMLGFPYTRLASSSRGSISNRCRHLEFVSSSRQVWGGQTPGILSNYSSEVAMKISR